MLGVVLPSVLLQSVASHSATSAPLTHLSLWILPEWSWQCTGSSTLSASLRQKCNTVLSCITEFNPHLKQPQGVIFSLAHKNKAAFTSLMSWSYCIFQWQYIQSQVAKLLCIWTWWCIFLDDLVRKTSTQLFVCVFLRTGTNTQVMKHRNWQRVCLFIYISGSRHEYATEFGIHLHTFFVFFFKPACGISVCCAAWQCVLRSRFEMITWCHLQL